MSNDRPKRESMFLEEAWLTSHQSMNLLERLGRIIEMGQRLTKGATH